MVIREYRDGLIYSYSNEGYMIVQNETGDEYVDAYDVLTGGYTYRESENLIPVEMEDEGLPEE